MEQLSKFYTVPEVAKLLRVKKGYVYELVATRKLKAVKLSARRLRVPEAALNEYIQNSMNE